MNYRPWEIIPSSAEEGWRGAPGWCWSRNVFFQCCTNHVKDDFQSPDHFTVFKPNDAHAESFEKLRSISIVFRRKHVIVTRAIKFDNDATFRTIEVDNIRTYSVLP